MNGQLVYTIPTREGFVFTWKVAGDTALNDSWWHYRHDESNTGTYGVDTGGPLPSSTCAPWRSTASAGLDGAGRRLHGRHGRPLRRAVVEPAITASSFWSATPLAGAPAPQPAGAPQSMAVGRVSSSAVYFAIRTVDMAGKSRP